MNTDRLGIGREKKRGRLMRQMVPFSTCHHVPVSLENGPSFSWRASVAETARRSAALASTASAGLQTRAIASTVARIDSSHARASQSLRCPTGGFVGARCTAAAAPAAATVFEQTPREKLKSSANDDA
jgi:hypothetical protein